MKKGDKLKVIQIGYRKKDIKRITEGDIISINDHTVTIKNTRLETFSFNDFISEDKIIFINGQEEKLKLEGGKYVLRKISRRNTGSN